VKQPQPPDPRFPRYASRPFPAYRFLHGHGPHPRFHPDGHSYQLPDPECHVEAAALERGDWPASPHYRFGVDLYNYAYWWEAHEAWEAVWKCYPTDHPLRHVLQCLIQVSAAHLQRHMGIQRGADRLMTRAACHLEQAGVADQRVCGLPLQQWWDHAARPFHDQPATRPFPFLRPGEL
jgi:uncharacterized protein